MSPQAPTTEREDEPLTPAQEAAVGRVRRLMLISSATLVIGMGAVFGVIGYKVYKSGDSAATAEAPKTMVEAADTLPPGGRVVATAIGEAQILVMIEVNGVTELRTYDPDTLQPLGRLKLAPKP